MTSRLKLPHTAGSVFVCFPRVEIMMLSPEIYLKAALVCSSGYKVPCAQEGQCLR